MLTPVLARDDIALKFLKLILPARGYYIAAIKSAGAKGFRPSIFTSSPEDLLSAAENADRDGLEVYFAPASFREALNDGPSVSAGDRRLGRTKHNVLGAKSFWLDIDVGPEKAYGSQDAALNALMRFCEQVPLPHQLVMSSGRGLHVYLPLRETLDRPTWEHHATGLKVLCNKRGFHADPARTCDIASVMRIPGTHNRKHGASCLVELDPEFLNIEPYAIEQLAVLAEAAGETGTMRPRKALPKPAGDSGIFNGQHGELRHLTDRKRPHIDWLAGLDDEPDIEIIIEQCEQVRALRDREGALTEPLWYAALEVYAFCGAEGDQLAHEHSRGDQRYNERVTQERLERARQFGPTTCEKFHGLEPPSCERCPWWGKIKSPIVMGRQHTLPTAAAAAAPGAVTTVPRWDCTARGALKPHSYINASIAIAQLGIRFSHDVFHNRKLVEGGIAERLGPELSDAIVRALRDQIINKYGVDCGLENVRQAAERACERNRFDPVSDYLDGLRWDGQPRLDRWLIDYLGAEDTPLNHSIGRKVLIAAVRRARSPGRKFDHVMVLEGKQGAGKSSAIQILAGPDNFSDQPILHLETRAQQEAIEGVWLYELSELAGMGRRAVEMLKNFFSKNEDSARPAYGRFRVNQPRRCIFIGTTNDSEYLQDDTGNRRFWPVRIGTIRLELLTHYRDQLWGEAAAMEASGESLTIPEDLWGAAAEQQEQRRTQDPWDGLLADARGAIYNDDGAHAEERIASDELLTLHLRLPADKLTDAASKRLRRVMNRLDWQGPKKLRFDKVLDERAEKHRKSSVTKQGYWRRPAGDRSG
jgi:hypothetical protein